MGDKLKVAFKDVPQEFEKDVNDGKYKRCLLNYTEILKAKVLTLKLFHSLGAATPQVKGLEPIKFMESEADTSRIRIW